MENNIKKELEKIFIQSKERRAYIVKTKTKLEGRIIYEFLKEIGVKILDSPYENYSTVTLFDIYYSKTEFVVSYFLPQLLNSKAGHFNLSHTYNEFKSAISSSHVLYDIFCQIENKNKDNETKRGNVYLIKFIYPGKHPNWANISNIDKKTFDEFVDYLYSLKRNIDVLPYISGGMIGMHILEDLDRTYIVKDIVDDIKKSLPKNELFDKYFVHRWNHPDTYKNPFNLFFKEDVYEFVMKNIKTHCSERDIYNFVNDLPYAKSIEKDIFDNSDLFNTFNSWLFDNQVHDPWIGTSRWDFIYMFRNEFIQYMNDRGYEVVVEGGWVLNDKERETRLGLIDENGELL